MQSLQRSKTLESSNGSTSKPRKFSAKDFFQTCCPDPVSHRMSVDGRWRASRRWPLFSPKLPSSHKSSGIGRLPSDSRHFTSPLKAEKATLCKTESWGISKETPSHSFFNLSLLIIRHVCHIYNKSRQNRLISHLNQTFQKRPQMKERLHRCKTLLLRPSSSCQLPFLTVVLSLFVMSSASPDQQIVP